MTISQFFNEVPIYNVDFVQLYDANSNEMVAQFDAPLKWAYSLNNISEEHKNRKIESIECYTTYSDAVKMEIWMGRETE